MILADEIAWKKLQRELHKSSIEEWRMSAICACCNRHHEVRYHVDRVDELKFYVCPPCVKIVERIRTIEDNWKLK